jgi:hypothetical protein
MLRLESIACSRRVQQQLAEAKFEHMLEDFLGLHKAYVIISGLQGSWRAAWCEQVAAMLKLQSWPPPSLSACWETCKAYGRSPERLLAA